MSRLPALDDFVPSGPIWDTWLPAARKATAEFMAHYHGERNHQGLDNALICPGLEHAGGEGEVHRQERLGGPLNY